MANLAKWNAALTWSSLTMSSIASLANGNASFSSAGAIDNTTNLNTDLWVSISFPTTSTAAGAPVIGIYLLPLNEDGTTYGDNTSGTTVPSQAYFKGNITLQPSLSSVTLVGSLYIGQLDPNKFTLAIVNNLGNALGSGTNVVKYGVDSLNLNS